MAEAGASDSTAIVLDSMIAGVHDDGPMRSEIQR